MSDKFGAVGAGVRGVGLEFLKAIPGVGAAIEGYRSYKDYLENEQEQAFKRALLKRVTRLEQFRADKWIESDEGQEFVRKLVASALDAANADKVEFFASALANHAVPQSHLERLKFLELLRSLSKPALLVLATAEELHKQRGPHFSPQVIPDDIIRASGLDGHLVHACMNELYATGVFSSAIEFHTSGSVSRGFNPGTPAFTPFSQRFADFLRVKADD